MKVTAEFKTTEVEREVVITMPESIAKTLREVIGRASSSSLSKISYVEIDDIINMIDALYNPLNKLFL